MQTISEMVAIHCVRDSDTRKNIARRIGISTDQFRRKLRGQAPIYFDEARELSRILNVSLEELYQASPRRSKSPN